MMNIDWTQIRQKLREDIVVLPHFLRNPVQGMRSLPLWEWPTILILQAAFAAACSVLANLIERDFFGVFIGLFLAPITNLLLVGITAGFFTYFFLIFFKRDLPYRQVYLNVLFSSIPLMIVSTVAFVLPPLILVGSAASLALLFVGLVDNFQLPRKPLRNILFVILAVHVAFWGFQQFQLTSRHKSIRAKATPESLDILEKELNQDQGE